MQNVKVQNGRCEHLEGSGNPIGRVPNTIVVRPFKVVRSCPGTRLKPRTTLLRFELSF